MEVNWYLPMDKGRYKTTYFKAKQCTQDDFGNTEEDIRHFNIWNGFSLICPDFKEGEGLMLEGEPSGMKAKNQMFSIEKCDPNDREGKLPCKSVEIIDDYIRDV